MAARKEVDAAVEAAKSAPQVSCSAPRRSTCHSRIRFFGTLPDRAVA